MATYHKRHPRGFANEVQFARAETPAEQAALAEAGYTRITVRELRAFVGWLNGENAAWGSGRAIGNYSAAEIMRDPWYAASSVLA